MRTVRNWPSCPLALSACQLGTAVGRLPGNFIPGCQTIDKNCIKVIITLCGSSVSGLLGWHC